LDFLFIHPPTVLFGLVAAALLLSQAYDFCKLRRVAAGVFVAAVGVLVVYATYSTYAAFTINGGNDVFIEMVTQRDTVSLPLAALIFRASLVMAAVIALVLTISMRYKTYYAPSVIVVLGTVAITADTLAQYAQIVGWLYYHKNWFDLATGICWYVGSLVSLVGSVVIVRQKMRNRRNKQYQKTVLQDIPAHR
jgi:hypothetical protein